MKFIIEQKLPSLNEVISANRNNKFGGAKLKRDTEDDIRKYIQIAQLKGDLRPIDCCEVSIKWHERTRKRDADNIQSSQKFILDSLVSMGILKNDNRNHVRQIHHEIIDDDKDYVEVELNGCV